jgi:hypothetical protein
MSTLNSKFQIADLDFDLIKLNLKEFLRGQSEFSDYDFEGSGLSVLLDILSYNTQYLAFYLNMIANEQFLDSAALRNSIISIAKQLNYTPQSCKCATAVVNLVITPNIPNPPAKITINKFTKFSTMLDGTSYIFVTDSAYTLDLDLINNIYTQSNVILKEGLGFTYRYTVDTSLPKQRFIIPSPNVDLSTVSVRIQVSSSNTSIEVYRPANDINELNGNSLVYFVQESEDGKYEIFFGDDILGKKPIHNNIIIIEYITGNKYAANKADTFTVVSAAGGFTNVLVTTTNPAYGGEDRESLESVRFSAPRNYEAQNRAVTASDYKTLLTRDYPNLDALSVWGGENNDPPIYGKVFISLKPKSGFVITNTTKETIKRDILASKNIVTVIPEIIDPEYIFLIIDSIVKYNPSATTLSANQIKNVVINAIINFASMEINKFERTFRYTRLVRAIDLSDNCILNNLTNIQMQKNIIPLLNLYQDILIKFNNAIKIGSVTSSKFIVTSDPTFTQSYITGNTFQFDDDSLGNLRIYKQVGTSKVIVKANAGTVDYSLGQISIKSFLPANIFDLSSYIKMMVIPNVNDVIPVRNNILVIDNNDINVSMVANNITLV